jgi:hypothetical protein
MPWLEDLKGLAISILKLLDILSPWSGFCPTTSRHRHADDIEPTFTFIHT